MGIHSDNNLLHSAGHHRHVTDGLPADLSELLDVHDLAKVLGVGERYVYRLVSERRIPFVKLGHYVRFDPDDVRAWLSDSRVPPTLLGPGRHRRR